MTVLVVLVVFFLLPVKGYEDENQYSECPEGRAAVTKQRQRDADNGHESDRHADVDEKVHEYARGDTVAVDPGKSLPALLCVDDYPPDQEDVQ